MSNDVEKLKDIERKIDDLDAKSTIQQTTLDAISESMSGLELDAITRQRELLEGIVLELRKMNTHLSIMTDEQIDEKDIEK